MIHLTNIEWTMITVAAALLSGGLVFFLKDVFKKNDKQSDDIQDIQQKYAPRDELNKTASSLRNENKSVSDKIYDHEKEIHHIKENYVTKTELKELKAELREESKALTKDVADIKANFLTKDDFLQAMSTVNRAIEKTSEDSAKKYDKMYDILLELKGEITRAKN